MSWAIASAQLSSLISSTLLKIAGTKLSENGWCLPVLYQKLPLLCLSETSLTELQVLKNAPGNSQDQVNILQTCSVEKKVVVFFNMVSLVAIPMHILVQNFLINFYQQLLI